KPIIKARTATSCSTLPGDAAPMVPRTMALAASRTASPRTRRTKAPRCRRPRGTSHWRIGSASSAIVAPSSAVAAGPASVSRSQGFTRNLAFRPSREDGPDQLLGNARGNRRIGIAQSVLGEAHRVPVRLQIRGAVGAHGEVLVEPLAHVGGEIVVD